MSIEIRMPKLSDTMEEGTIVSWRVSEGDRVQSGDIIAEVETDKATMEMEAFESGVVSAIKVQSGEMVPVGTLIAVFEPPGEEGRDEAERPEEEAAEAAAEPLAPESPPPEEKLSESPPLPSGDRIAASPAARRLARQKGITLDKIKGSGPGGRIVLSDVESLSPEFKETPPRRAAVSSAKKSIKIRRIMARKMAESWESIPHFYVTMSVDMTDVIRFRKDLGVSINDFVLAAAAHALQEHPWVNSHWIDGEAVEQPQVNIAMAVATDRGLYNPVIRNCDSLSLKEISRRASHLSDKAHGGVLSAEDMDGGTFTITNMGMLGVDSFAAIITAPQAAVLAVGTVKGEVVIDDHEEVGIAPILRITLSADHRILDGADAADFLATIKSYLEAPIMLVTCND